VPRHCPRGFSGPLASGRIASLIHRRTPSRHDPQRVLAWGRMPIIGFRALAVVVIAVAACDGRVTGGMSGARAGETGPTLLDAGPVGESCSAGSTCPDLLTCRSGACQNVPSNGTGKECRAGSDCPSRVCLTGGVCTTTCKNASDCVAGWRCPSSGFKLPEGGPNIITSGGSTASSGDPAISAWTSDICQCTSSPEICDGKDNDCDGVVDNEPQVDQTCESIAPGYTCQSGACACKTECGGAMCVDTATDPHNCGACRMGCSGTCSAGRCRTTLGGLGSGPIGAIAVDATSVYWTESDNTSEGRVVKVPIGGGVWTELASGQNNIAGIAVDARSVYWANQGTGFAPDGGSAPSGSVVKVPIDGGTAITLVSGQSPIGIAVDATSVYWANGDGTVMSVPTGGGTPTTLASGPGGSYGITVDSTSVYWTTFGGAVMKVPLIGGGATTLASGLRGPRDIAVDSTSVYFTNDGNTNDGSGTLMKVPVGGGAVVTLAGAARPGGIAVDSTSVYWGEGGNGASPAALRKAPLSGGAATTLASDPGMAIAVDSTSIYFATAVGTLIKLTPK
jgi:hypothetical protein